MPDIISVILTVVIAAVTLMIGLVVTSNMGDPIPVTSNVTVVPTMDPSPISFIISMMPILLLLLLVMFVLMFVMGRRDEADSPELPSMPERPPEQPSPSNNAMYQSYINQLQANYVDTHHQEDAPSRPPWVPERKERPRTRWEELEI